MPNREPIETTNLDTMYGSEAIPWSRPRDILAAAAVGPGLALFLGTVRPDGRPHAAGIGAAWYDGDLYFQCGPRTRKARTVAANPACTMSESLPGMEEAVAAIYREGWPVQVDDDTFTAPYSAPSAGPPPWHLIRLTAHTVFGVATAEPHGAARRRF